MYIFYVEVISLWRRYTMDKLILRSDRPGTELWLWSIQILWTWDSYLPPEALVLGPVKQSEHFQRVFIVLLCLLIDIVYVASYHASKHLASP